MAHIYIYIFILFRKFNFRVHSLYGETFKLKQNEFYFKEYYNFHKIYFSKNNTLNIVNNYSKIHKHRQCIDFVIRLTYFFFN